MSADRCRKHCLHPTTPSCDVCCRCGRGVNHAPQSWPPPQGGWVPASQHGPHYIGPAVYTLTRTGSTEITAFGHPYGITHLPLTRTAR